MLQMAALRFLFRKVLQRRYSGDDLPLPRLLRRQVPIVLSQDEVPGSSTRPAISATAPS